MILEEQLLFIVQEQNAIQNSKKIIPRNCTIDDNTGRILVVTGVRRCGKSTLLKQHVGKFDNFLSLNFEDPRLENFDIADFYKLESIAENMEKNSFVFDEIQNVNDWEKYVRAAHDRGIKMNITGSNASMLSKELGTRLTGRYKQMELFPFDYREYLVFSGLENSADTFKHYIMSGGFPEYLTEQNPEYLQTLLKDIGVRDIVVRHNLKNQHLLVRLAVLLMSSVGKELSYNNITKDLNIKSVRSTIDYCDYLQESYLVEFIPRFSFSVKQQQTNPKKVYAIDTGLAKANSLSAQPDWGRLLENIVYLQLRKQSANIQYYKDEKTECDFLVKEGNEYSKAIQVCWQLTPDNLQRELTGLKNAMNISKAPKGIIITLNQKDKFENIDVSAYVRLSNLNNYHHINCCINAILHIQITTEFI